MGWGLLGTLGKIGAGIAAPFTGGASLAAIPAIDAIGSVASGAAKGSADQRIREGSSMADAYTANLRGTQLQDRRAMLASLLGGMQDATVGRPAGSTIPTFQISGGLRPSSITNREALMQQLGTPIQPLDMPTAGLMEKILGGVGLGANILGALGKRAPQAGPQAQAQPPIQSPGVFGGVKFGNGFLPMKPGDPGYGNPYIMS